MRILGFEIRRAASSGLAKPQGWLVDALSGEPTYAGVPVTAETAMRLSAVWACVQVLSQSVARLPIILYKRSGESKSRATDHPLYRLLHDQPNADMTAYAFKQALMVDLCLQGNGYAEIERDRIGRPIGLMPIPQSQFIVTPKRENSRIIYSVRNKQGVGEEFTLPADQVFHLMGMTQNGLVGMSPIEAARQGVGLGLAAEEYGARFFGNGANLGGVLKHPGKLSKEAHDRLAISWQDRYEGIKKSHRTAILEEGMDYAAIGIPPKDAAFLESRKYQLGDIARIYRVPPHMIGDLDRATWGNIEHQGIEFVVHTLGPWLELWRQVVSIKLLGESERDVYFGEFLTEAFLRGDTAARYAAYATGRQNGWLSANDIRIRENMDPIDGGDVYLVPLNMVPADQVGNGRAVPAAPAPTTTRGMVSGKGFPDTTSNGEGVSGKGFPETTETDTGFERRMRGGAKERQRLGEAYSPIFRDVFLRIFRRERNDIMRQAKKAGVGPEKLVRWLEDYFEEHPEFVAATARPALSSYAEAIARTTESETGETFEALPSEVEQFVRDYTDSFSSRTAIASKMRAVGRVREAEETGEDMVEALDGMFNEWEQDRADIETEAETNQAGNAVAKAMFVLAGISVLRWSANATACPLCQTMDGKVVGITQNFLSVGQTVDPEDEETQPLTVERNFGHPPLHRGCQCQVEPG